MSAGQIFGAGIAAVPVALLVYFSFILPFDPNFQEEVRKDREETGQARLVQENLNGDVSSCLKSESPWQCFVKLSKMDITFPVPREAGASRTQRLANSVSADDVLAFCLEPRKVNCATRMVGKGWSDRALKAAIGS